MTILNGNETALKLKEKLKLDIQKNFISKDKQTPKLVVIMIGNNPASQIYVAGKAKACAQVGIQSEIIKLPETVSEKIVAKTIKDLNKNEDVNGILLQLPIPDHINASKMIDLIAPEKDVDGLNKFNLGKLISKENDGLFGCTPSGIVYLLKEYNISLAGKNVVIINRSLLVGKPLALMLLNEDATVTICHSKTKNLKKATLDADIIIVAVGKKNLLTADMVKKNAVVVDVGINRNEKTKKICGDCDFTKVSKKTSYITPVPGGVGPMTIAFLLQNTYKAYLLQKQKSSAMHIRKKN